MAKNDWVKVKDRKSGGKKTGVVIANTKTGEERTLLNTHGKYQKAKLELERGVKYTNDGAVKRDNKNRPIRLNEHEITWRKAYSSAIIDQTKAYNAKNGGKK